MTTTAAEALTADRRGSSNAMTTDRTVPVACPLCGELVLSVERDPAAGLVTMRPCGCAT